MFVFRHFEVVKQKECVMETGQTWDKKAQKQYQCRNPQTEIISSKSWAAYSDHYELSRNVTEGWTNKKRKARQKTNQVNHEDSVIRFSLSWDFCNNQKCPDKPRSAREAECKGKKVDSHALTNSDRESIRQ
jgi:hypothetical protein